MAIKLKSFSEFVYDHQNNLYAILSSITPSEVFEGSIDFNFQTFTTEKPRQLTLNTGASSIEPDTKLGQFVRSAGVIIDGMPINPEIIEEGINNLEGSLVRFKFVPRNPKKPREYKWKIDPATVTPVLSLPDEVKAKVPKSVLDAFFGQDEVA